MDFTTIIVVAVVGYVAWKSGVFDKLLGSTKYSTKPGEVFDFVKIAAILAALKTIGMAKASMLLSPKKKDDE